MGLSIKCLSCNSVLKIDERPIINCQITHEKESIHSIFKRAVEQRLSSTNTCCKEIENYILDEDQKIIFLKFEGPFSNVSVENVNRIVGQDFRILSYISSNNMTDGIFKEEVHFNHGDFCLSQHQDSLELSHIEDKLDEVYGIVLGKIEFVNFSKAMPYTKYDFAAAKSKKYEDSQEGKEIRKNMRSIRVRK